MQFARGIAFLVASLIATVYAFSGSLYDGELSGGVILLNLLSIIFGWLGGRDLWRRARTYRPRHRNLSSGQIDRHLERQVAAHLRDLELERQRSR